MYLFSTCEQKTHVEVHTVVPSFDVLVNEQSMQSNFSTNCQNHRGIFREADMPADDVRHTVCQQTLMRAHEPHFARTFFVLAFRTKLPHSIRFSSLGLQPTLLAHSLAKSPRPKPHPSSAEQKTTLPCSGLKVHSSRACFPFFFQSRRHE